ncbi:MAG: hypothetical protein JJ908_14790 [Rhizobiales bacterium]|nr:hypothetical protein [Hyphomicrobiales bacterium]MBO6700201.1 hypothetical protein [Hyphomicrobiales bacterium]MBO6737634.1 hypothetical protein [Hyphomicrobiales bacterium]MBO6913309.1 hypothetical protein [Hyphomicrobiales bacterium]MBO6956849.1 hypothetical protein [Hyphomicrobiales bacterium]
MTEILTQSQTRSGSPGRVCSFRANLLARAFDYPYALPTAPITFDEGRVGRFLTRKVLPEGRMVAVEGVGLCVAILAVGSNAAVSVLRRKFGSKPVNLVQGPVRLNGHAKVHSAHIARYGSMPATLMEQTDQHATTHLQLVPVDHLAQLDASEAVGTNYDRVWLDQALHVPWLRRRLPGVWTYRSRHGPAMRDGTPMVLGSQRQALAHAAERAAWALDLPAFVYLLVRDMGFRSAVTQALKT